LADSFGGRDRLILHGGGERERRRVRHEIGGRKTETALHKCSSRKTRIRHDFLLAYDFCGYTRVARGRPGEGAGHPRPADFVWIAMAKSVCGAVKTCP